MDNYTVAWQQGYNALWEADTSGCPYEDETLRNAWFQGYYEAEHDVFTGNF